MLELLLDLFVDFGAELIEKTNYSRKTRKESIILFSCISMVCLAAIIGLVVLFFLTPSVGLKITLVLAVMLIILTALIQLNRFLRRMK